MNKKSAESGFNLSTQVIIIAAIAWAVLALLFFLLFSVPVPGEGRPGWYTPMTYLLENLAFLGAAILCFRNWGSSQIVSGRTVWLLIGLGMLSYFIGNMILAGWELAWGKSPEISPGDLFFLLTYLLLGFGMGLAVVSRKLDIAPLQWLIVVGTGLAGTAIAYFVNYISTAPENCPEAPAIASAAPQWAIDLESQLLQFGDIVTGAYVIGDVLLVMSATTLLVAFWGGRFSLSWRFIASAAICFFVADMWFFYATNSICNYETGAILEVFWIFSACLFAIGAALEYSLSTRSRRGARRRV